MGGFAAYVWPSFAVTAIFMIGLVIASRRSLRADQRTLEALRAASGRRRSKPGAPGDAAEDAPEDAPEDANEA